MHIQCVLDAQHQALGSMYSKDECTGDKSVEHTFCSSSSNSSSMKANME